MSHDGTSHVLWWDPGGTGSMCVPGTGLMRLDRDETSAGTEKLSLVTYNLLRTYTYACILNLEIVCTAIEPGHMESPQTTT